MQGPAARQGKKDQTRRGPGPGEAGKDGPALHPSSSQQCPVDTQSQRGRFSKGAWNLKDFCVELCQLYEVGPSQLGVRADRATCQVQLDSYLSATCLKQSCFMHTLCKTFRGSQSPSG